MIRKKYEILSEIGRGGMGVVYRARHLIWNEEKALKVLVAAGAASQQGLKGLMAEALVMRQLQHPHIVRVEDADYTEDDQPFVVMEYVDGQSLRQKLDREGPLAPELALQIAAQTCSALSAAHQKGIIHRDIKPPNLLLAKSVDGSETVKIIDFGIAKVREEAGLGFTGIMTGTTGFVLATPGYASPEQAFGMRGSDLDGRTDLYSLGLMLYEMLTGRLPFAADTPVALLVQRLQVQPLPPDRLRPDLRISSEVSRLVVKAIEKERENRYRSAEEMQQAITGLLDSWRAERDRDEAATTRRTAEREQPKPDTKKKQERAARLTPRTDRGDTTRIRDERRPRRRTYRIVGLAVASLALVAAGLFVTRHVTEEKGPQSTRVNSVDGLTYVFIPPGGFMMGCSPGDNECLDNEKPPHPELIANGFWLGRTEVTQNAWKKVMGDNPSYSKGDQLPVENVDWSQASDYCRAIGGRLPTEKEWEYAARAGTTGARYGPLDAVAWYDGNSGGTTHPAGLRQENAFGLYDMLGNVWEWTADNYDAARQFKAVRGGSWNDPRFVRASSRVRFRPTERVVNGGFRCVAEFR